MTYTVSSGTLNPTQLNSMQLVGQVLGVQEWERISVADGLVSLQQYIT